MKEHRNIDWTPITRGRLLIAAVVMVAALAGLAGGLWWLFAG